MGHTQKFRYLHDHNTFCLRCLRDRIYPPVKSRREPLERGTRRLPRGAAKGSSVDQKKQRVITGAGAVPPQSRTAAKGRAMPEYSFRKPGERGEIIGERWRGVEMEKDVGGEGGGRGRAAVAIR